MSHNKSGNKEKVKRFKARHPEGRKVFAAKKAFVRQEKKQKEAQLHGIHGHAPRKRNAPQTSRIKYETK